MLPNPPKTCFDPLPNPTDPPILLPLDAAYAFDPISWFVKVLFDIIFRKVQRQYGLVEMHLEDEAFLFTGQIKKTLGSCFLLYHHLTLLMEVLVCISHMMLNI